MLGIVRRVTYNIADSDYKVAGLEYTSTFLSSDEAE